MKNIKKLSLITLALLTSTTILASCNKSEQDRVSEQQPQQVAQDSVQTQQQVAQEIKLAGKIFGTTYHISYNSNEVGNLTPAQVQQKIEEYLASFNTEVSTYDPNSEISQFNASEETGVKFPIKKDFAANIELAKKLYDTTNHYLDITVYPIVKALGFGPGSAKENLSDQDYQNLKAQLGMDKFELTKDGDQYSLIKYDGKVQIDLSAIAKGYGVDRVADILSELGVKNYLVEIGGEVVAKGLNSQGNPWVVAIEKPTEDGSIKIETLIALNDQAIATSGSYRNFRYENGKRITHEIDPFTGKSITHNTASLTVIADDCATADGLSTGLYVMGSEKALELADKLGLAILVIDYEDNKFVIKTSKAFDEKVKQIPFQD